MKKITSLMAWLVWLTASSLSTVLAQSGGSYDLSWSKLAGGGGTCAGGAFTLNGMLGQPDAGVATGGSFSLDGGFWPPITLPPVGPSLRITRDGFYIKLSWPTNATGFSLYKTANVTSRVWSPATDPAFEENGELSVWLWPAERAEFYQLIKP